MIQRENPLARADWDSWISSRPRASFFHSAAWARVLQATYGFVPVYFAATQQGRLDALLPLMEVNSRLTGRRGVSLPFTDHCELLGEAQNARQELLQEALAYGRVHRWKYLELRGAKLPPGYEETPPSVEFLGHELKLSVGAAALFDRLDSSVRRAVRKAEKSGLTIHVAQDLPSIHAYYRLHCLTRRCHGLPPQPFSFFRNIHGEVLAKNMGTVISARMDEQTVAAAIFFQAGGKVIYKFGASDRRFQELRANNFVMWEAIKHYTRQGAELLHFGRTSMANAGLRRYKLAWGADEHHIRYHKYDFRKNAFVADADATSGVHVRLFRALPISVARLVGSILYRHVA